VFRRLLKQSKNKTELAWWHVWQTLMMQVEAQCCTIRERTWALRAAKFATSGEKRSAVRADRLAHGTRHDYHRDMGSLMHRQHMLVWRSVNVSELGPSQTSEGVKLAAQMLGQSEGRLSTCYRAFDESLRAFEARLPQSSVTRRCSVIPADGNVSAIPGFEGKSAEETVCSICITQVDAPGEQLCMLDCGHAFHLECVESWLHGHPNCPNCRTPVVADDEPPEVVAEAEREEERERERLVEEAVREEGPGGGPHAMEDDLHRVAQFMVNRFVGAPGAGGPGFFHEGFFDDEEDEEDAEAEEAEAAGAAGAAGGADDEDEMPGLTDDDSASDADFEDTMPVLVSSSDDDDNDDDEDDEDEDGMEVE
jgi:hypothetical protein